MLTAPVSVALVSELAATEMLRPVRLLKVTPVLGDAQPT